VVNEIVVPPLQQNVKLECDRQLLSVPTSCSRQGIGRMAACW